MLGNRHTLVWSYVAFGLISMVNRAGAESIDLRDTEIAEKAKAVLRGFTDGDSKVTFDTLDLDNDSWRITLQGTVESQASKDRRALRSNVSLTLDLRTGKTYDEQLTLHLPDGNVDVDAEIVKAVIENDLAKALALLPAGKGAQREIRSDYHRTRDKYESRHGRANVYFASPRFVRWAGQGTAGRWVAAVLAADVPASGRFMKQAKNQSLRDLADVASWLESHGQQDAVTVAHQLLSGREVEQPNLIVKWQQVRYASRLTINGRQIGGDFVVNQHAAFVFVWTGAKGSPHLVNTFPSSGPLETETSGKRTRSVARRDGRRQSVELKALACFRTQDTVGWDEAELRIWVDGRQQQTQRRSMDNGDVWNLKLRLDFEESVKVQLWDRDRRNGNDFIGEATISAQNLSGTQELRDGFGHYRLEWDETDS